MGFSYEYFQKYLENLHNLMCRLVEELLLGVANKGDQREIISAFRVAQWVCRRVNKKDAEIASKSLAFAAKSLNNLFRKGGMNYEVHP